MKTITSKFEYYRNALEGVGPKTKELILSRAAQDEGLALDELVRLCRLAYPDEV